MTNRVLDQVALGEKAEEMVAQMSRYHTRVANWFQERLLRRRDRGNGGLRRLYHVDDWFGQGSQ